MNSYKLFCLLAICLVVNARVVRRQKKVRRICQKSCPRPVSVVDIPCSCPIESYGGCNCQNVIIDEPRCGCKYVEILPELPTGRRIALPKTASCDRLPVPIMPEFLDFDRIREPCACQSILPWDISYLDTPCACKNRAMVEYVAPVELPCPKIRNPYAEAQAYFIEPPNYLPQVIQVGYPNECGCKKPCVCKNKCPCDNPIKVILGLPDCGCAKKLPAGNPVELPFLGSPLPDLPVLGYGCPPIPPPEIGCGKYLRQVPLQPPFI